jgi:SAM-dependent methyltransferase
LPGQTYYHRDTCRLCRASDLTKVLALTPTPPANAFVTEAELCVPQPAFPLDVWLCNNCGHVQLLDVVDARILYQHYVYVSGTSPVFVRHFERYARYVSDTFGPAAGSLALDIGSNDGTLLRFFKGAGHRVLGVEPAEEISEASRQAGIPTLTGFFGEALADRILREHGHAAVVTANNVIAHIDDLAAVTRGVAKLLAPDGVFVFEVSYLVDVLEKTLFDTIYHEHLDYHSVEPLQPFFRSCGLELIEALRVDSHGGSLRGVAQRAGGPRKVGASVAGLVAREREMGLRNADTFRTFGARITNVGSELTALLEKLKREGKRIAGFGAPAKATTLLYHLGITPQLLDFIVDDSPLKQGRHTPGMHIPVLPAPALYERGVDYTVILAWNFAEPIMKKHSAWREGGGRFIVPLPKLEVH